MPEARIDCTYLLIGNSAGGIGAAEAIRQADPEGSIVIAGEEPYAAYSRPEISNYLAGQTTPAAMSIRPATFYEDNRIRPLLGRRAEAIDLAAHSCRLDDGTTIGWQRLLLATGGRPIVPPLPGMDLSGVFTFTTIADAERIRNVVHRGSRVAVIGGGLIGLSVTHALVDLGASVTVIELLDRVLATALDGYASSVIERALEQAGVRLLLSRSATSILPLAGSAKAGGVALDGGETVPADAVIVAVGVGARAELARDAGIEVNRGVIVDRAMRTSHPDVYACGDCAEGFDFVAGAERVVPVWPNAYMGGRVAGLNMAGREGTYAGATGMNAVSYFGLAVVAAGAQEPGAGDGWEVLSQMSPDGSSYRKVVLRDGLVAGLTFVGEIEAAGIVFGLMRDRVDVSSFKDELVSPGLAFGALPPELRRQRIEIPVGLVAG